MPGVEHFVSSGVDELALHGWHGILACNDNGSNMLSGGCRQLHAVMMPMLSIPSCVTQG